MPYTTFCLFLPLVKDYKVCLSELTGFELMIEDELLTGTSAVIAVDGDLDLQVCVGPYGHW